ncbi:MAG: hypothetical protein EF811_03865 [Methanonatronarchaeia archaeon]|nr:MAG: hypothetical protein EF811_03865 [Methanonatronarchaeia archaeon]
MTEEPYVQYVDASKNFNLNAYDPVRETIILDEKLKDYPLAHEVILEHELKHYHLKNPLKHAWHDIKDRWRFYGSSSKAMKETRQYYRDINTEWQLKHISNLLANVLSYLATPLYIIPFIKRCLRRGEKSIRRVLTGWI